MCVSQQSFVKRHIDHLICVFYIFWKGTKQYQDARKHNHDNGARTYLNEWIINKKWQVGIITVFFTSLVTATVKPLHEDLITKVTIMKNYTYLTFGCSSTGRNTSARFLTETLNHSWSDDEARGSVFIQHDAMIWSRSPGHIAHFINVSISVVFPYPICNYTSDV